MTDEVRWEIGTNLELFFLTERDEDGHLWFVHGIRKEGKCRQAHRLLAEEDDYPPDLLKGLIDNMTWQLHILSRKRCYNPNDLSDRMPELERYDVK